MMMNTGELIQNKKFTHKAFCIIYSILFTIAWSIFEYVAEYTGNEVKIFNLIMMTLFVMIIIIVLTSMITELDI